MNNVVSIQSIQPENEYLDEREAAIFLCLSIRTLQSWRRSGKGPIFKRFSRRAVRYTRQDLREWAEKESYQSTAEYADHEESTN